MQGKKSLQFGKVEVKASLNWATLATSLAIAVLTWASAELIPQLTIQSGKIGIIAGLVAQAIPMIVMYLRNNQDIEVISSKKEG